MNVKLKSLLALSLLAGAPAAFAQYTMNLTGVGDGVTAGGVYVSPYQGTIQQGASTIYSGYMICDDFNTPSSLNTPWAANASSSNGVLTGGEKFGSVMFGGNTYTAQQAYNAAAWLAVQLVQPSNVTNAGTQVTDSFAIWNIFDSGKAGSSLTATQQAAVSSAETAAFTHDNTVESNVTVYTPSASNPKGISQSQEFLVVNPQSAPEMDATSAASGLTLLLGGLTLLRGRRQKI